MKKTAAVLAAAMALTISVYASPQTEFAKGHMEKGILLLEQYKLLYTNDSIPQINNYAA